MANWNDTDQRQGFGSVPRAGDAVARQETFDAGLRKHMLSIYNYMTSGVLLTGVVAFFVLEKFLHWRHQHGAPEALEGATGHVHHGHHHGLDAADGHQLLSHLIVDHTVGQGLDRGGGQFGRLQPVAQPALVKARGIGHDDQGADGKGEDHRQQQQAKGQPGDDPGAGVRHGRRIGARFQVRQGLYRPAIDPVRGRRHAILF